jgi:hypothetical protein
MIAEIPQLPQVEASDGVLPVSPHAPVPAIRRDFGRRISLASMVAGIAACLVATLLLPGPDAERKPVPAAQVASAPPFAATAPSAAPALALAPAPDEALSRGQPRQTEHHNTRLTAPPQPAGSDVAGPEESQLAAASPPAPAPIDIAAPNRIAVAPVAGPPAPGTDDLTDGNALAARPAMGPRDGTGMGFDGGGVLPDGTARFPGGRR